MDPVSSIVSTILSQRNAGSPSLRPMNRIFTSRSWNSSTLRSSSSLLNLIRKSTSSLGLFQFSVENA